MKIIIVGCGKVGTTLAEQLNRENHDITLIDCDSEALQSISDRKALLAHLGEVVLKDPVKTTVVDMTALNLVELTRKKVRKPLHEQV